MSRSTTKPIKWLMPPAKTQISVGILPVWSESSLCTQRVAKGLGFLYADSEDSDQTCQMPMLIWDFAQCWFCHAAAQMKLANTKRVLITYEPSHKKTCLRGCLTRCDSNLPAQLQKPVRHGIILSRHWTTKVLIRLWMHRLICAFIVGIKQVFSWHGSYGNSKGFSEPAYLRSPSRAYSASSHIMWNLRKFKK